MVQKGHVLNSSTKNSDEMTKISKFLDISFSEIKVGKLNSGAMKHELGFVVLEKSPQYKMAIKLINSNVQTPKSLTKF